MTFLENLSTTMNMTKTENGADTYVTTNDACLDFFALGGATRKNLGLGLDLFKKAWSQDRIKAVRILFYLRDIRGGQGERDIFRACMKYVGTNYPETLTIVSPWVAEFGRYDDLFALFDVWPKDTILNMVKDQLTEDLKSKTPSLLAKWMPSENTSSEKTRKLARKVRNALGATEKEYRKMLSKLRAKIKLVEHSLSKKEYASIEYSKIPSQAGFKYKKAFRKHDEARYEKFLENVTSGKEKINTKTLYPYQIYKAAKNGDQNNKELDVMWNNLPDYTQDKNALVMADVSGSMSGDPMSISVSLALYFADKNKGYFKNHFITFSAEPKLQKVEGKTIKEKMNSIEKENWDMNTDMYKVFKVLVMTAQRNSVPTSEMPETIYIISDMEFDEATQGKTNYQAIADLFKDTEYRIPNLVFWNVEARNKQVPVGKNEHGVVLVSGFSPSIFKMVVENKTPLELMDSVINSERYAKIVV